MGNDSDMMTITQMKEHIRTLEKILSERMRVMEAIPACPVHGSQCVPHAIEWVTKQQRSSLIKLGPSLEADGVIDVYEIETAKVVAQYEGLEVHEQLLKAAIWEKERAMLLDMTSLLDEHPEGYEGPCMCQLCCDASGER